MKAALAGLALLSAGAAAGDADAAAVADLDAGGAMTWLVKSVCTDAADRVLPVDPYGGCPAGAGIRKLRSGDPLPYHNFEQEGYQQRDAFPVYDPLDGETRIVAPFDYTPFDRFNLFDGIDGYDVFTVRSHWATIASTSDGGGYGQTFYGANCRFGGGWVLFPTTGFRKGGRATVPASDIYWEQSGQSFPGSCPWFYSTTIETSWRLLKGRQFGGINGNPVKTMDALVSYHGFRPTASFLATGHMEVFYFTREYGITRWEVWIPAARTPRATTECSLPPSETYQGVALVVQNCHDWSSVTAAAAPGLPLWPIPNINLLAQAHFDGDITQSWNAAGNVRFGAANSTAARDTAYSPVGVRYLAVACGGPCRGFADALYQDVPASSLVTGTYAFGINARSEPAGGAATSGTIGVAIEQLDAAGEVLSADSTAATIASDNGVAPSPGEPQSVYLSSAFVAKTTTLTLLPNAATVRFLISPQSAQTFEVLDAWFAPWPVPTTLFGSR